MTKFRTPYDNLQISRSASLEVIKAAYRTLSAKYHPDRNLGDEQSAEIMSRLNGSVRPKWQLTHLAVSGPDEPQIPSQAAEPVPVL